MGIDWDGIVLGPATDRFAIGAVFSSDVVIVEGRVPRVVWEVEPHTIIQENQEPLTTSIFKVGLRLSDFATPPKQGSLVTINGQTYTLASFEYDGQGGVRWVVKAKLPGQATHGV
jgi:hypothetical protein